MASSLLSGGGSYGVGCALEKRKGFVFPQRQCVRLIKQKPRASASPQAPLPDDEGKDDEKDASEEAKKKQNREESNASWADDCRDRLERMVDTDEARFNGKELAAIIRKKYGKSYDVQLIKREFMGRQLLAMNVMWKFREQRSFPLSEEEYILRLDEVANMLRCWGAVSYVRRSIENTKERPRIGKAVSIFIDMDESGGRANEWIYR